MTFLEKDLENIIWETDNMKLRSKNFKIYGKKFRQLKIGNYGILDLMTVEKRYNFCYDTETERPYLDITIYELKKEKVGISAFLQALRYVKGVKTYITERTTNIDMKFHIILCAKEVDLNSSFIYLTDFIEESENPNDMLNSLLVYSFEYTVDGIWFKNHKGYNLVDKGF